MPKRRKNRAARKDAPRPMAVPLRIEDECDMATRLMPEPERVHVTTNGSGRVAKLLRKR